MLDMLAFSIISQSIQDYFCHSLHHTYPIVPLSVIVVNRLRSKPCTVNADVLQGSILGSRIITYSCIGNDSRLFHICIGKCFNSFHASQRSIQHSRSIRRVNSLHSFCVQVPQSWTVSRSSCFFVRTAKQWNSLPANCFPDRYDLSAFKRHVNARLKSVQD